MKEPIYSDLDLRFTANALTGDCGRLVDEAAVRRAILRVVKTRRFDVPYEPDKSAWIDEFLFEPSSPATLAALKDRLSYALAKMEPRATYEVAVETAVKGGYEGYEVEVVYTIKSVGVTGSIKDFLERVR